MMHYVHTRLELYSIITSTSIRFTIHNRTKLRLTNNTDNTMLLKIPLI